MRIRFIGHACFQLHLADGTSVVIDPFEPGGLGGRIGYPRIPLEADLVLISHDHADHADASWLGGRREIARGPLDRPGLTVSTTLAAHDEFGGNLRSGHTRIFSIRADGVHVVHCGDLGERLPPHRLRALGDVDVLLIPVGGYYTLGAEGAAELVRAVAPRYAVPYHYRTPEVELDELAPLSSFTRRFERSRWPGLVLVGARELDPAVEPAERPAIVCLEPVAAGAVKSSELGAG